MAADTAKQEALDAAAMAADTAKQEALDAAAMAADTAKQEALDAAAMAADTAKQEALDAAAMAADTAKQEALDAAAMAADTAKQEALDAAAMAADTAKQAALDAAKEEADATLKVVQDELDELRRTSANALAEAAKKDKIAREVSVRAAIIANSVGTAAKAGPTTAVSGVDMDGPVVKRNVAGMVTVDVNGATDDVYAGGETAAGSGDWNSVTMTRTDAGTEAEDTLVIYTDIDAPKDTLLTARYSQTLLDNALGTDQVAKVQSDGFPSGPGVTSWTYDGTADGRAKTVAGTFDGVAGQFTCTAMTCTVATDITSKLTATTDWRFTPTSPLSDTVKVPGRGLCVLRLVAE